MQSIDRSSEVETSPLALRVDEAIATNPYLQGRKLRFETSGNRVTLHGQVNTYFQKQMAQELLKHVEGVGEIENGLEVMWH
ncbi:transport-associated [Pirellula staleyi DSM 6068]|uniref:Transport-associated n=1 Tax=Pirellula staleyi (strain ATCC 27377 / DSM 6068 / ICPB 4128) TaxID=530564 RepID=D2QZG0_PIRSD|nr:BON domain-containing protein [Pirellula staleyi]ADB14718.1 transport-associated [Pirellula staleyi DSM 6068]